MKIIKPPAGLYHKMSLAPNKRTTRERFWTSEESKSGIRIRELILSHVFNAWWISRDCVLLVVDLVCRFSAYKILLMIYEEKFRNFQWFVYIKNRFQMVIKVCWKRQMTRYTPAAMKYSAWVNVYDFEHDPRTLWFFIILVKFWNSSILNQWNLWLIYDLQKNIAQEILQMASMN